MLDEKAGFSKLAGMNPSKVAVFILFLAITLLLLGGCEELLQTESNPPGAVVPSLQPGAPIPGGLRIVSAHATPLIPASSLWKPGTVNVRFNGAATTAGLVYVEALSGGWNIYRRVGSANFVQGQTDVQVPISVDVGQQLGDVPLKVHILGRFDRDFETMTHYSGKP